MDCRRVCPGIPHAKRDFALGFLRAGAVAACGVAARFRRAFRGRYVQLLRDAIPVVVRVDSGGATAARHRVIPEPSALAWIATLGGASAGLFGGDGSCEQYSPARRSASRARSSME